jgi:glutamine amidotransferase-like uncharacterized protein
MKRILIFNDYGVSEFSERQLKLCFERLYSSLEIREIKADDIQNGTLNDHLNETLLCFGGGFDLGYLQSLGNDGCERIRKFVLNGGNYLGICAGAYFACESILFDENGPLQVTGDRPLKFFPGQAIGPVNKLFKYNSDDFALAVKINLGNDLFNFTYLNGGCYFEPNQETQNQFNQIACYSEMNARPKDESMPVDNKLAIIEAKVGLGKCLLSGVHFEFNADDLDFEHNENIRMNVYPRLSNQEALKHSNETLIRGLMSSIFKF